MKGKAKRAKRGINCGRMRGARRTVTFDSSKKFATERGAEMMQPSSRQIQFDANSLEALLINAL